MFGHDTDDQSCIGGADRHLPALFVDPVSPGFGGWIELGSCFGEDLFRDLGQVLIGGVLVIHLDLDGSVSEVKLTSLAVVEGVACLSIQNLLSEILVGLTWWISQNSLLLTGAFLRSEDGIFVGRSLLLVLGLVFLLAWHESY